MYFRSDQEARRVLATTWHWPNFSLSELVCRCAGRFCERSYWHDPLFLDRLQALRTAIGKPLRLTSAHRCSLWNAAIGGGAHSQHKRMAVDISLNGHDRHQVLSAAKQVGFTGFGLAKSFLHLDARAAPAMWYYPGGRGLW